MPKEILSTDLQLRTFSVHEKDLSIVKKVKVYLFKYKHLENILNLLLKEQFEYNQTILDDIVKLNEGKKAFNFLTNAIVMKAVLSNNLGGDKTREDIAFVNHYFKNNDLFIQAKLACNEINDKNISMVVRRLKKDWSNYFLAFKDYCKNPSAFTGKPSYPKAKKLSKVYNYSLPLESDKFSLKKKGYLGLTLGKRMFYVYIGHSSYFHKKIINNFTISLSHGHIYYNFTYCCESHSSPLLPNAPIAIEKLRKEAGGDVGLNNIISLFINDNETKSLVISGKELISYNCNFNKKLAKINIRISDQVKSYKNINDKNGTVIKVPESYTNLGKKLIYKSSQLFERRKLFFNDYIKKLSKKIIQYLSYANVTDLVLSKNLSFSKTNGNIKLNKKTKQKFYQIPFGNLLNLIEDKAKEENIHVTWIDEAYTSKTSSISSEVVNVQKLSKIDKSLITPNDLNGNRGVKKTKSLNNKLGRGLFKDNMINKIINADLNAACNHIKIGFKEIDSKIIGKLNLFKFCNPLKIKSNHEFDKLLSVLNNNQIVDIHLGNDNKYYLSQNT